MKEIITPMFYSLDYGVELHIISTITSTRTINIFTVKYHWRPCWLRTASIPSLQASQCNSNTWVKLGRVNIWAEINRFLSSSNAMFASGVQEKDTPFHTVHEWCCDIWSTFLRTPPRPWSDARTCDKMRQNHKSYKPHWLYEVLATIWLPQLLLE